MPNWVPMAERLEWPSVTRPRLPLVYLDLNHYINLAKAAISDGKARPGYARLLDAAHRAVGEQRAFFPLSGELLFEVLAIKDPRQRKDIVDIMEALSGYGYLLGRPEIAHLEIEAGIQAQLGESPSVLPVPLTGRGFGWALGMVGGLKIVDESGEDVSSAARREMGASAYDDFMREANYRLERTILEGPPDAQIEELRANGYAPESAHEALESRLMFELDLSQRLQKDPKWRKGRLRDIVSAREFAHEWLDTFNRIQDDRTSKGRTPFSPSDEELRHMMAALPHVQVAVTLKTAYHRNSAHCWTTNDIIDIDAMSVAYAYCDAVFTDKAIRSALADSRELRQIHTFLPRTPIHLATWLDGLTTYPDPWLLVPASRGSARTEELSVPDY